VSGSERITLSSRRQISTTKGQRLPHNLEAQPTGRIGQRGALLNSDFKNLSSKSFPKGSARPALSESPQSLVNGAALNGRRA